MRKTLLLLGSILLVAGPALAVAGQPARPLETSPARTDSSASSKWPTT